MGVDDVPLDDKAKRMRDLLSSFYAPDPSVSANASSKYAPLDAINTSSFDADQYMNLLVQKSSLEGLLQRHVEMAAEIKNLDTDLQMLVYENYNKFISATDTIKRMNSNIVGMETNMEQLLEKIKSVQSRSDGVNTSLFEKRENIEKLHRTRNLLRKVQFIYDLPAKLGKCIKSKPMLMQSGSTLEQCQFLSHMEIHHSRIVRASEEVIAIIIKNLQGKLFSDYESIQTRAEAAVLLKQLNFPVDSLKSKLLEKLEQSLGDLQLKDEDISSCLLKSNDPSKQEKGPVPAVVHTVSIREFVEAVKAYRVIFPDSEKQLIKLAQDLVTMNFEAVEQYGKKQICSADLLGVLGIIWNDVLMMDEALNEAVLSEFSLEAAQTTVKHYVASRFSHLLRDISDALTKVYVGQKEGMEEYPLQVALEASKKALLQGSMDVLLNFCQLLADDLGLVVKLKDLIIDWVQEGFQEFFSALDDRFLLLSGRINLSGQVQGLEGTRGDKVLSGLVLVLAQLSVFIEQTAIPRITEEIAVSFSGGGVRGYENGPAFVPGEICRIFRSAGEKLLHHYINMRNQRISVLLRKRFTTPNWVKHKEPREVHMFVDLFLQELKATGNEVHQILPRWLRRHHRTDSNGSTTSSRSNPLREDKLNRSNTQKARSQLLETHLAKLFKQKVEIFTKVEYTQESVITTVVKLSLKSLQEFVRLQTFNRSGFQQIQLDIQFLRTPLKETVEDEAAIDFLLDEVIVASAERCLDPIPLEPPILDKLILAKLAKTKEQNAIST